MEVAPWHGGFPAVGLLVSLKSVTGEVWSLEILAEEAPELVDAVYVEA